MANYFLKKVQILGHLERTENVVVLSSLSFQHLISFTRRDDPSIQTKSGEAPTSSIAFLSLRIQPRYKQPKYSDLADTQQKQQRNQQYHAISFTYILKFFEILVLKK